MRGLKANIKNADTIYGYRRHRMIMLAELLQALMALYTID